MTFDVLKWLHDTVSPPPREYHGKEEDEPRHQILCRLVYANGGFSVRGWGFHGNDGVHRSGLGQDEAMYLMRVDAFLEGLEACGVDWSGPFDNYWIPYRDKYNALRAERAEVVA